MTEILSLGEVSGRSRIISVNGCSVPSALFIEDYSGEQAIYERIAMTYGFRSMEQMTHATNIRVEWANESHTRFITVVQYRIPEETIGLNWDCYHDAYRYFVCECARNCNK